MRRIAWVAAAVALIGIVTLTVVNIQLRQRLDHSETKYYVEAFCQGRASKWTAMAEAYKKRLSLPAGLTEQQSIAADSMYRILTRDAAATFSLAAQEEFFLCQQVRRMDEPSKSRFEKTFELAISGFAEPIDPIDPSKTMDLERSGKMIAEMAKTMSELNQLPMRE